MTHPLLRPLPGLMLATVLAALATLLQGFVKARWGIVWLSPLVAALCLGVLVRTLLASRRRHWLPALSPGLNFAGKKVLRWAVALLGLQLTFAQVLAVGLQGVAVLVATLGATFLFVRWLGARLGIESGLVTLLAAGTSICGASAVVAANSVVDSDEADVTYAVAMVSLFGTLVMLGLPLAAGPLQLSDHQFGLWTGASLHEVAQVVAAAWQHSPQSGETGTIAKLTRVMMLAPVVALLGWHHRRQQDDATVRPVPVPWFVGGFLLLTAVASAHLLPAPWLPVIADGDRFALTLALGALGLATDPAAITTRGWKPLLLAAAGSLFILTFALAGVELFL